MHHHFSISNLLFLLWLPGFFPNFQAVLYAGETDLPEKPGRPSVGLVLSGGGAKGFAYIGLLQVLQETGLQIDYVGGSSIGSIMGGLYALGYHPDSIANMIRSQNWDNLMTDKTDRKYVAYEEKEFGEKTIISLPVRNKKIALSPSLYQGQEINLLLNHYFSPAYRIYDFDDLPIPFLCMGTDLITGESVVLNHGYLPMAIRSSMSIPGYFSPTEYMGHYLVDGGVVNNYPAKEVREMGARIIIGGNVQSGLYTTRKQLGTLTAILDQITSFSRLQANQIGDSLTDIDVRIKLDYGMMSFTDYDSIIAEGEKVARSHYDEIKALADSLNAIEFRPLLKREAQPLDSLCVDSIIVRGNTKTPRNYFMSYFREIKNSKISMNDLQTAIRLMYGSNYFEHVFYEFDHQHDRSNLIIEVQEDAPGILSAGIHFDNDYNVSLMVNGAFRNMFGKNTKLFANLVLGINPRLKVMYLIGFGGKAGIGIATDFYSFKFNLYDGSTRINEIVFTNYKASLFFTSSFRNMYNIRAGFDYEYFRFRQEILTDTALERFRNFSSYGTPFIEVSADTRDAAYFATKGFAGTLRLEYAMPLSENWVQEIFTNSAIIYLKYNHSIPLSKHITLRPGVFAGGTLRQSDSPPVQHLFALGGLNPRNYVESFVSFTGVQFIQQTGNYAAIARLKLQYNMYKKMYLTLRSDAGANQSDFRDVFKSENFMIGYGLTYSYSSFIGPIELTVMGSNMNPNPMLFLNIGYWF